jgi:hypothetical protein
MKPHEEGVKLNGESVLPHAKRKETFTIGFANNKHVVRIWLVMSFSCAALVFFSHGYAETNRLTTLGEICVTDTRTEN